MTEVVKRAAKMAPDFESRVVPIISILIGIAWNWLLLSFLQAADARPVTIVLFGLLSGLAASGLWSGGRNAVIEPMQEARRTAPHG